MGEPKQVIVMRKDLGMRKGKMIAQGAHASIAWLADRLRASENDEDIQPLTEAESLWINGRFTKICVYVNSEEELLAIHQKAREEQLRSHLITDAGVTEFSGVPTPTCCAIGPEYPSGVDWLTGELPLL